MDDEPFNIQGLIIVLKAAVKLMGFEERLIDHLVDKSYNGKEAVEMVKKQERTGQVYCLIFMDCSMPIMDGYEAITEIRKQFRLQELDQPYIVACTGHTENEFIIKAWRHEFDEIVPKPAKIEVIMTILKEIVELKI